MTKLAPGAPPRRSPGRGLLFALLAAGLAVTPGCSKEPAGGEGSPGGGSPSGGSPTAAAPPTPAVASGGVFDPANPPPGWIQCHRNHCHHKDGRVAPYAQVMREMGATSIKGEKREPPPPAPPDVAAPPADAIRTASGLASKVIGEGKQSLYPTPTSTVEVHYTGWTTDGRMFDSSIPAGRPVRMTLDKVIPGLREGLQLMVVGEQRRFWIPEELAYKGRPGAPQGMLVFDVELLNVLP